MPRTTWCQVGTPRLRELRLRRHMRLAKHSGRPSRSDNAMSLTSPLERRDELPRRRAIAHEIDPSSPATPRPAGSVVRRTTAPCRANWARVDTPAGRAHRSRSPRDRPPTRHEHDVLQADVVVADDRPPRVRHLVAPDEFRRIEPCRRGMQLGQERGTEASTVRSRRRRVPAGRPTSMNSTLPTVRIDTHRHRRTTEPRPGERPRYASTDGVRVRRPQHVNPDADHPAAFATPPASGTPQRWWPRNSTVRDQARSAAAGS